MPAKFLAFGEILWDCLPSGRHAGGAPFNVAAHLAQLGAPVGLISAIGSDLLGDEILQLAEAKGVQTQFITKARAGLATGTVLVTVDARGNAAYEIVQPVAWDEIKVPDAALPIAAQAEALIFGSLAGRSPSNLRQLDRLLAIPGPTGYFDVNLRPPFDDPALVMNLAKKADVLKLNDDELGRLTSWLHPSPTTSTTPGNPAALAEACGALAAATGAARICVTRGAQGAAFWDRGALTCAPAPQITVRDTIGAGDAFMAGLIVGLARNLKLPHILESACRLGAYVASQSGATPPLPSELIALFQT
jgi:fructokinase